LQAKRGIIFDVGFGAGSFYWYVAVPALHKAFRRFDFRPAPQHECRHEVMTNSMLILNLGAPLNEVVDVTWNPARQVKRPQLGNLDVGRSRHRRLRVDRERSVSSTPRER
jgi:dihydroorotase